MKGQKQNQFPKYYILFGMLGNGRRPKACSTECNIPSLELYSTDSALSKNLLNKPEVKISH
jgi:hypothetical protein